MSMYVQSGYAQQPQTMVQSTVSASGIMPQTISGSRIISSGATTQTVVRQAPTYAAPQQQPQKHQGAATEAISMAHTMHNEIKMMETTIIELQEDNEMLKWRLLQSRRASLEKYFTADARLLQQGALREWNRFALEMKRMREIDGMNSMRGQEMAEYEKRLAQLERDAGALEHELGLADKEAADLGNAIGEAENLLQAKEVEHQQLLQRLQGLEEALQQERDQEMKAKASEAQMLDQLAKAEKVIKLVMDSSSAYTHRQESQSRSTYQTSDVILKDRLHKVLKDTDVNYLPPLDKLGNWVDNMQGPETMVVSSRAATVQQTTMVAAERPVQTMYAAPQTMMAAPNRSMGMQMSQTVQMQSTPRTLIAM